MIALITLRDVLIYLGIPLAFFVVLAIAVYASTIADGPRYRPGLPWHADPVWINGPDDHDVETLPARLPSTDELGGASARW